MSIVTINNEATMTLKEITDILEVRHDKAMKVVEKMAESSGFGWVDKLDIQYSSGKGRVDTIQTYKLTRRQSMAVSAKLNTDLLMKVIDRLDELENKTAIPQNYSEALMLAANQAKALDQQAKSIKAKDDYIFVSNEASIKAGEMLVREFAKSIDFIEVGEKKMFAWLREQGFLMKHNEPFQRFINQGLFTWKPSEEKHGGKIRYTPLITPRGKIKLAAKYLAWVDCHA